ncbi:MAG: hypothetical protein V3T08_10280 [Gemmatimonadota bacterium]
MVRDVDGGGGAAPAAEISLLPVCPKSGDHLEPMARMELKLPDDGSYPDGKSDIESPLEGEQAAVVLVLRRGH